MPSASIRCSAAPAMMGFLSRVRPTTVSRLCSLISCQFSQKPNRVMIRSALCRLGTLHVVLETEGLRGIRRNHGVNVVIAVTVIDAQLHTPPNPLDRTERAPLAEIGKRE